MGVATILAFLISKYIRGPRMPWIAVTILMIHASIVQKMEQPGLSSLEYVICTNATKPVTMLYIKLTSFCWAVHDGRTALANHHTKWQRERRITTYPKLIELVGFAFFLPTLFAETPLSFVEYQQWINEVSYSQPELRRMPSGDQKSQMHQLTASRLRHSLLTTLLGCGCWAAYALLAHRYPACLLLDRQSGSFDLVSRMGVLYIISLWARLRGYKNWLMAEGGLVILGLGCTGVDPATSAMTWSGMTNVRPLDVELAQNSRAYIGSWNMSTADWLKHNFYLRIKPAGCKEHQLASIATFFFSALWHGFEAGFWLTFGIAAFVQLLAKGMNDTCLLYHVNRLTVDSR